MTLITNASSNEQFGVTASLTNKTGDTGVLEPAVGNPNQMVLQDLPNRAQITPGMQVVTAGYADPANPQLNSLYPPGILIGTVASFNPNELLNSGQVPVTPTANVRELHVGPDPHQGRLGHRACPGEPVTTIENVPTKLILRIALLSLFAVLVQETVISKISIFGVDADITPLVVMSIGLLCGSLTGRGHGLLHRVDGRHRARADARRHLAAVHHDRLLGRPPARAARSRPRAGSGRLRRRRDRRRRDRDDRDPVPARRRRAGQPAAGPADLPHDPGQHADLAAGLRDRAPDHHPGAARRPAPSPAPRLHDRRPEPAAEPVTAG